MLLQCKNLFIVTCFNKWPLKQRRRVVVEIMQDPWTNNVAPGWYQYEYTNIHVEKKNDYAILQHVIVHALCNLIYFFIFFYHVQITSKQFCFFFLQNMQVQGHSRLAISARKGWRKILMVFPSRTSKKYLIGLTSTTNNTLTKVILRESLNNFKWCKW